MRLPPPHRADTNFAYTFGVICSAGIAHSLWPLSLLLGWWVFEIYKRRVSR